MRALIQQQPLGAQASSSAKPTSLRKQLDELQEEINDIISRMRDRGQHVPGEASTDDTDDENDDDDDLMGTNALAAGKSLKALPSSLILSTAASDAAPSTSLSKKPSRKRPIARESQENPPKSDQDRRQRLIELGIITPFDALPTDPSLLRNLEDAPVDTAEDHQLHGHRGLFTGTIASSVSPSISHPPSTLTSFTDNPSLAQKSKSSSTNLEIHRNTAPPSSRSIPSASASATSLADHLFPNNFELGIQIKVEDDDLPIQQSRKRKSRRAIINDNISDAGYDDHNEDEFAPPSHSDESDSDEFATATTAAAAVKPESYDTDSADEIKDESLESESDNDLNIDDGHTHAYLTRLKSWVKRRRRLRDPTLPLALVHENLEQEMYAPAPTGNDLVLGGGYACPGDVYGRLFSYQKTSLKWLWELRKQQVGGIIGDQMGLGKTIQIISFLAGLSYSHMLDGKGPILIVCPATVLRQWVKELHIWWPPFRVWVAHSTGTFGGDLDEKAERRGVYALNKMEQILRGVLAQGHVLLTTYAGIRIHRDILAPVKWSYVVLDEGHKIRNPDADITLTCKQLRSPHRIILSGTPIQNNLKELWSLFDFVFPGRLGTLPVFEMEFSTPINLGGYANASNQQIQTSFKCAVVLRDLINPYLLRRMKADVAKDLPQKTEQVLFVKLTDSQREVYRRFLEGREVKAILDGRRHVLYGIDILRKICNHPDLVIGAEKSKKKPKKRKKNSSKTVMNSLSTQFKSRNIGVGDRERGNGSSDEDMDDTGYIFNDSNSEEEPNFGLASGLDLDLDVDSGKLTTSSPEYGNWPKSGKLKVVKGLLDLWWYKQRDLEHKVLLFCQTRQMQDILEKMMRECRFPYLRMDGTTPIKDRGKLVDEFNASPSNECFVFLLTTRVGGLGINLTAANRVIIYDPDWNPSLDEQSRERAWRLGQKRKVVIYRLMTAGTIEEKILQRQIYKTYLASRILKDPKQKRFFESNQLKDLFSLTDQGQGTETGDLFAGLGAEIQDKRKLSNGNENGGSREQDKGKGKGRDSVEGKGKGKAKDDEVETLHDVARVESFDKLRPPAPAGPGALNTAEGNSTSSGGGGSGDGEDHNREDMRVLEFMGLHSALKHDVIMDTKPTAEAVIVEREAQRIAESAVKALKQSRANVRRTRVGVPTWTGRSGAAGLPLAAGTSRLGSGRFGAVSSVGGAGRSSMGGGTTLSSKSILASLRGDVAIDATMALSPSSSSTGMASSSSSIKSSPHPSHHDNHLSSSSSSISPTPFIDTSTPEALGESIRTYFNSLPHHESKSKPLIDQFKKWIKGAVGAAAFKQILKEVAVLEKERGVWILKKEYW